MTAPAAIGAALPSYEIGPELGRGGFGIVYAGRQRHLGRDVAIKQLPPSFSNDEEIRSRFATEARVLASLDHPHIVPIYDYVEQDGLCLLVMECLTGGSVWDTFRKEGLTPARACVLVVATSAGLHHAHINGVLHRDVKPENLLLTAGNHLKVTDFGIAKVIGGADAVATSDGGILGTPAYMAPEQADGGDLSAAADVYAAGTMLYELLSGTLPFSQDGGGLAIVYRHLYEQPNPLRDIAPQVPQPLADVVMRSIARQPSDRYSTAEEFAIAIGEAAVESFGDDWYQASGLRVIGSDVMMGTLTGGGRDRRRAASTTIADSSVAPAGWNPEGNRGQRPTAGEPGRDAGDGTISAPFENLLAPPPGQQPGPGGPRPTPGQPSQGYPSQGYPSEGYPAQGYPSGDPRASQPGYPGHGSTPGGPNAPASYQYGSLVPYESAQLPVMRPSIFVHVVGEISPDSKPEPLVPVRQILKSPPIPAVLVALTTVVLLALLVVAYVGLGTGVDRTGTVQSTVTLAGTDVSTKDVTVDLGTSVPVSVNPLPAGVTAAELKLFVRKIPIGSSDKLPLTRSGNGGTGTFKLGSVHYLVPGPVTGKVVLLDAAGKEVGNRQVQVTPSSNGFLTVPGVVAVLALLFALAYLESLALPLWRRGKRRVASAIGLALVGALLGVVLTGIGWALHFYEPNVLTAVVCAVIGAVLGILFGLTAAQWGLHARVRRINKKQPVRV